MYLVIKKTLFEPEKYIEEIWQESKSNTENQDTTCTTTNSDNMHNLKEFNMFPCKYKADYNDGITIQAIFRRAYYATMCTLYNKI